MAKSAVDTPLRVLVLCTANSARSQIAQALLRARGEGRIESESAGAVPADRTHPAAIRVLETHGIPVGGLRPKRTEEVLGSGWDLVVTVCDHAKDVCPVLPDATVSTHWGMPDPDDGPEQAEACEDAFRTLSRRVDEFLRLPIEALSASELGRELEGIGS